MSGKAKGKRTYAMYRMKSKVSTPIFKLEPKYTKTDRDAHAPDTTDIYLINKAPPITALRQNTVLFVDAQGFQYYNGENQKLAQNVSWSAELHQKAWFEEKRDRIFIIRKKVTVEENVIIWPQADASRRIQLKEAKGKGMISAIMIHSGADVPLGVKKRSTNVVVLRDILYE